MGIDFAFVSEARDPAYMVEMAMGEDYASQIAVMVLIDVSIQRPVVVAAGIYEDAGFALLTEDIDIAGLLRREVDSLYFHK